MPRLPTAIVPLTVVATTFALCSLLFARTAHANTPQTRGAFMAFGGHTDAADGTLCLAADTESDEVYTFTCYEADYVSDGEFWELESDSTIHLISADGSTDYGCLDVYANNPSDGIVDLNPGTTYPCHNNAADEWLYTIAGEIGAKEPHRMVPGCSRK